jgi:lysophospholipase L1-like esterase
MKYFLALVLAIFSVSSLCAQGTGPVRNSKHYAFGDSVTAGTNAGNATPEAQDPSCTGAASTGCYASLLAYDEGATLSNYAIGGSVACDVADQQVFPNALPAPTGNPVYTIMAGYNDAIKIGAGSYEPVTHLCNQASFSYLATSLRTPGSTGVTANNGWANDTRYAMTGALSSTNGSSMTLSITTSGGPIYIWYELIDGNGGTFTYQVDTNSAVSEYTSTGASPLNQPIHPGAGSSLGTRGVGLIRVPVPSGTHYVQFVVTSASSSSNTVEIVGLGTPSSVAAASSQPPIVYVGGIIKMQDDMSSGATSTYNGDVYSDVNLLAGDGLPLVFANVRNYLCVNIVSSVCENASGVSDMDNGSNDLTQDYVHPNGAGHGDLKQAFETAETAGPAGGSPSGATSFVTAERLTSLRGGTLGGGYRGYAGFVFTTGSSPITVTTLGRWVAPGNSATHVVEIAQGGSSPSVLGSVTVPTAGVTSGAFNYVSLATPITLSANTTYYVLSQETNSGDQFYNGDTQLTTTPVGSITNSAYTPDNVTFSIATSGSQSFGPVSFQYTAGSGGSCIITTSSLPNGTVGTSYDGSGLQVSSTNCGSGTYSATGLPSEMQISSTGLISGTPTAANTYSVTITNSNGGSVTLSLVISASSSCSVNSMSLPAGTDNTAYTSTQLTATGSGCTGAWALASGSANLPTGLQLSSSGVISGTPTGTPGTTTFSVVDGTSSPQSFSITVNGSGGIGSNSCQITGTKTANLAISIANGVITVTCTQ